MKNKWLDKGQLARQIAAAFAFAALVPAVSVAAPPVVAGDFVKLYDGPGNTGGGEFWVDVVGKGASGTIDGTNYDFITFCLERNEYFNSYGQSLKVSAVNTGAVNGGYGGQTSTNFDPLSNATAWLYTSFSNGTLLDLASNAYTHTQSNANSLQRAIWALETEITSSSGSAWTAYQADAQAQDWVTQANNSGWTNIGQARVLNLTKWDGNAWVNSQDQLYITPIPEPETYAMLLAGLGLMGFVARRRRQREGA